MQFNQYLNETCSKQNSLVCVGLDVDLEKIPGFLKKKKDAQVNFSKAIIDATAEYAAAFKINTAFFEAYGEDGWRAMREIVNYIPDNIVKIADAKRGDIGNTSKMYAKAFFEELSFDAITVNPYLGHDAVKPFLSKKEKGIFVLCHTSNAGAEDFQKFTGNNQKLFELVAKKVDSWNEKNNCGLVVGATFPKEMKHVRGLVPKLPFLVPGLGAQGGDFDLAVKYATDNRRSGAIFNFSRNIIYASSGADFAGKAADQAKKMRDEINNRINI